MSNISIGIAILPKLCSAALSPVMIARIPGFGRTPEHQRARHET